MIEEMSASDYDTMEGQPLPNDLYQFAKLMIDDPKIPKESKKKFWGFMNKDTILTNSDSREDAVTAANDYAIIRNQLIMAQTSFDVNINELINLDNARRRFLTQHKRSKNGFERQGLTTQIKEIRQNRTIGEQKSGIITGLKKKLGFGMKRQMEAEQYGPNSY